MDLRVHYLEGTIGRMVNLGEFGVWQPSYATTPEMARRLEGFGFTALWLGGPEPDLAGIDDLLGDSEVRRSIKLLEIADPLGVAGTAGEGWTQQDTEDCDSCDFHFR